ncbi:MAG: hypothetical protein M1828_001606 [Chrysothrix sp. TS-e1954]|nr:MAG: hypothetical protein M1828_001606 [Chrysothrix sp. TS-e1954]
MDDLSEGSRVQRLRRRFLPGWRGTVGAGACTALIVLILNLVLLGVGLSSEVSSDGIRAILKAPCDQTNRAFIAIHLVINILSTLLLAASNSALQCAGSTSRDEVDLAHRSGRWVHVGVFGLRNLGMIPWKRIILCAFLAISSTPLHLLYNSAVFQKTVAWDALVPELTCAQFVASNFVQGASFDSSDAWCDHEVQVAEKIVGSTESYMAPCFDSYVDENTRAVQSLQRNISSLVRLENEDCAKTFRDQFVTAYSSVLLVSAQPNSDNSLLSLYNGAVLNSRNALDWACYPLQDTTPQAIADECSKLTASQKTDPALWLLFSFTDDGKVLTVDHCLAQRAPNACELDLSIGILVSVIVCNFIKLVCFVYLLSMKNFEPIITVGDAITSFLERPDPSTNNLALLDAFAVRHGGNKLNRTGKGSAPSYEYQLIYEKSCYQTQRLRWFRAASTSRWLFTVSACLFVFIVGIVLLNVGTGSVSFHTWGTIDTDKLFGDGGLIGNLLLANVAHFVISIVYLLYNTLFTCMTLSAEYLSHARRRRTVRVSSPRGAQRSTYWLQLPYRYAIPFMLIMATLHWLVSQSIYLVNIQSTSWDLSLIDLFINCGFNLGAVLLSCLVGAGLIISLIVIAFSRTYPSGMPLASSCSLTISAACHRAKDENEDITVQPIQYGVLSEVGPNGRPRTGFSARPVQPLIHGKFYD